MRRVLIHGHNHPDRDHRTRPELGYKTIMVDMAGEGVDSRMTLLQPEWQNQTRAMHQSFN